MIRVINPLGKLVHLTQIQPVCEKQVMFNGRRIIMMERARDLSAEPTALAMRIAKMDESCGWTEELLIGNLKPEKVLEIIRVLGEKEYYDFSALSYQKAEEFKQVVWDRGESAAYSNCVEALNRVGFFCDDGGSAVMFPLGGPEDYLLLDGMGNENNSGEGASDDSVLDWDTIKIN